MANRMSKEKADLVASIYCTNGFKQTEALIEAGYKPEYAKQRGKLIMDNILIKNAINQIQAQGKAQTGYSVEQCQLEYEQARLLAVKLKQPSAVVSAITGKARLYGMDKDAGSAVDVPDQLSPDAVARLQAMAKVATAADLAGPRLSQEA